MFECFESLYIYIIIPMLCLNVEYELILFCQHEYADVMNVSMLKVKK